MMPSSTARDGRHGEVDSSCTGRLRKRSSGSVIWDVSDPWGFRHRILLDHEGLWGGENLAHGVPQQKALIREVLKALVENAELPPDFRAEKIVPGAGVK